MTTGSIRQGNCEHDWEIYRVDTFENISATMVTKHRRCRKCDEYKTDDQIVTYKYKRQ